MSTYAVSTQSDIAIGHTIKELSAAYDFNEKTIRGIVHGQTYKNVVISPHELSRPVPNLPLTQSQRERQQRYIGRRAKGQPPERIFACPLCRLDRGYADEVFEHIREKHGQQHTCPACKNFRSYADKVLAHMDREHPRLAKRCSICFEAGALVAGSHDEVMAHMREKHPNSRFDYAQSIWGNSTLGLLSYWWHSSRQQSSKAGMTIRQAESLAVLDLRALTDEQLLMAEMIFDEFRDKELKPAYLAYADPNRALLDHRVVCDLLGFDEDVYEGVRRLSAKWCAEPSVHGGKARPKSARLVI